MSRKYTIDIDIEEFKILNKPKMIFYNTDVNSSYIYVNLCILNNLGIKVPITNHDEFYLKMNIVKPSNEIETLEGILKTIDDKKLFEFKLPKSSTNIGGSYKIEFLFLKNKETLNESLVTTNSTTYSVKKSILNDLDEGIEQDNNYPLLLKLIDEVKKLQENNTVKECTIKKLVGTESDPVVLNAINSGVYLLEKNNYYKYNSLDIAVSSQHEYIFIINKNTDSTDLLAISDISINKYIITENDKDIVLYATDKKLLEYVLIENLHDYEVKNIETTDKKLGAAINELYTLYKDIKKNYITLTDVENTLSLKGYITLTDVENTLLLKKYTTKEDVKTIINEMIKNGEISVSGGGMFKFEDVVKIDLIEEGI